METQDNLSYAEMMGEQLRKLRKSVKLSQEKFDEKMSLSRDTIYNYEKGKTAIPHDVIKSLCLEFDISADYFYSDNENPFTEFISINISDIFQKEMEKCTALEKKQLIEILKILRMKFQIIENA